MCLSLRYNFTIHNFMIQFYERDIKTLRIEFSHKSGFIIYITKKKKSVILIIKFLMNIS